MFLHHLSEKYYPLEVRCYKTTYWHLHNQYKKLWADKKYIDMAIIYKMFKKRFKMYFYKIIFQK